MCTWFVCVMKRRTLPGLWSSDMATHMPARPMTHRESPTLATRMSVGVIKLIMAVLPLRSPKWNIMVRNARSRRKSAEYNTRDNMVVDWPGEGGRGRAAR